MSDGSDECVGIQCCEIAIFPSFPLSIQAQLTGLLWLVPCINSINSQACSCVDPQALAVVLGGNPFTTYQVKMRIRGVLEPRTYVGGALVAGTGGFCYSGGVINPADTNNIYSLTISNPAQVYYINNHAVGAPNIEDFVFTAPMNGGAIVTLKSQTMDYAQQKNYNSLSVPVNTGDPPLYVGQPVNGQWAQVDVVSVA